MGKIKNILLLTLAGGFLFTGCVNKTETKNNLEDKQTIKEDDKHYPIFLKIKSKECKDVYVDKEAAAVAHYLSKQTIEGAINENMYIVKMEKDNKPLYFYFFTDKESCDTSIKEIEQKTKTKQG